MTIFLIIAKVTNYDWYTIKMISITVSINVMFVLFTISFQLIVKIVVSIVLLFKIPPIKITISLKPKGEFGKAV